MWWRTLKLWFVIRRCELALTACWTALLLKHPAFSALLMVDVLTFELYDFLLILDLNLADCTDLSLFIVIFGRIALPFGFIERYLFIVFLYFVEHPCVLLEPFLSCTATHYVQRFHFSRRGFRSMCAVFILYPCSHLRQHA